MRGLVAGDAARPSRCFCAGGAILPGLAILLAFPDKGVQPFSTRSALISFVLCMAVALAPPRSERAIRIGGALAAAAVAAAWAIDTPLGSNVLRLSSVFAAPAARRHAVGDAPAPADRRWG